MAKGIKDLGKDATANLARIAIEKISAEKTHEFKNITAAARILYGAFDCGDIEDEVFRVANEKLRGLDALGSGESVTLSPSTVAAVERGGLDIDSFISRVKDLRKKAFPLLEESLRSVFASKKLLFIDDEFDKSGWNIVLSSIFGQSGVVYQSDVEAAKSYVDSNADSLDIVLLDLRLKESAREASPEIGLQLLKDIKREHIDLPVIIFSGVDETVYTRKCLQAGATDYYVKEISEKDRIRYYHKFKEIILSALIHPEWREIWRRIKALPDASPYLLRAYYFLTSDPDDYRIQLIFSHQTGLYRANASIHSECILHCANAIEEWINSEINRRRKRLDKKYSALSKKPLDSIPLRDNRELSKTKILKNEGIIDKEQSPLIDELLSLRKKVAHARDRYMRITEQESLTAFRLALTILERSYTIAAP
jgi:DNA-binding NarL/FixJ family response regulator